MIKRKIRLMADFECYPLWEEFDDGIENIDPDVLPISEKLKKDLNIWAEQYDQVLNRSDPAISGFSSAEKEAEFQNKGEELFKQIRDELRDEFELTYINN